MQLATETWNIPRKDFRFQSESSIHGNDGLELSILGKTERTRIETEIQKTNLQLVSMPYEEELDWLLAANQIDLFCKCDARSHHFQKIRQESGLFDRRSGQGFQATGRMVAACPTPPQENGQTIDERLRWILTPPLHEILSDPSLGLPATPHEYQVWGIGWLKGRVSALLGDEMGLGKTMQAIIAGRLLWREKQIERILIVCPKTLVGTWRSEIGKWWPNALANIFEPSGDTRQFLKIATPNVTIKLINYEKLAREADYLTEEQRTGSHDLIIIDEAQRIKNPTSRTAKAVKALIGKRRWAITGTPLETKTDDVLSIFGFLKPGLLESNEADYVRDRIKPFLLRRRLEDVALDLPDKDDRDVYIELGPKQREAYERAEDEGVVALNAKGDTITVQHVFALIQKLMQLCNFEPESGESAKLDRLTEDLEEIIDSKRKALIFSQFVSAPFGLKELKNRLPAGCLCVELHGEVSARRRELALNSFSHDPAVNTMLLHYRVGGLGLNLQAANYVYLFDRWWNPAVEDQAVKRAHRIGQLNKVFIRRLACRDTIEERILQKLAERRRLFSHVIDEGRTPANQAMGLSEEEFFSLFRNLRVRPKRAGHSGAQPQVVLDDLTPNEFEALVANVYKAQKYEVQHVGGSHDGGVDIIAWRAEGVSRERIAVQCKHTTANVGRPDLQKLFGVISADQRFTRGDLVTSSGFSREAKIFASDKRIMTIAREELISLARLYGVAKFVE